MLIMDMRTIGNQLLSVRKRNGLTQAEVAERAGLSDRTYADIERGTVNMRVETMLKICTALHITPDEILSENSTTELIEEESLQKRFLSCTPKQRQTALLLLRVYFDSL